MSPQYERVSQADRYRQQHQTDKIQVNTHDDDNDHSPITPSDHNGTPTSPPPSFRSRASYETSRRLLAQDPLFNDANQDLVDTFDDGEASDVENDGDDRQRLMRATPSESRDDTPPPSNPGSTQPRRIERRVTELPAFRPTGQGPPAATDGVFGNLSAKLERGEQLEEKPPTYEQAAADATPPYWETTILAPGMSSDEVYVDGLPVGSVFSFVWNGMISMSFQLVGFLLTYLLHTTHAAKNGSRAGLGLTLVQYGFYMKGSPDRPEGNPGQFADASPPDPNSHNFDPNNVDGSAGAGGGSAGFTSTDWISTILMIVGWFVLIRAVSDFLRARKQEALIMSSPSRGLPVAVVAENETPEQVA